MSLNQQQKNIVNPYPEFFESVNSYDDSRVVPTGGANGKDYNYDSERNKWVLEGIHDSYLNYGYFPRIGKVLRQLGPLNSENNVVTVADAMAYAALYPQNAVVVSNALFEVPSGAIEDSEEARVNSQRTGYPLGLMSRTFEEAKKSLQDVAIRIFENKTIDKFSSITTPKLQLSENQLLFKEMAQKSFSTISSESQQLYRPMMPSMLVTIPEVFNDNRTTEIRKTFGNDPESPILLPKSEQQSQVEIYLNKQPKGLDLTEWSANIPPGDEKKVVYYNPRSRELYYCIRTNSRDPLSFDIVDRQTDQSQKDNVDNFKREALKAMIAFSERFYEEDSEIEDNLNFVKFDARYGDAFRPSLPAGYGVWLISARVPLSIITAYPQNLKESEESSVPIKTSPSSLQIARNLIRNLDPKYRFAHKVRAMEEYINQMIRVLDFYNDKLYEEGVEHSVLNKLNLEREIIRLEQFMPSLFELGASLGISLTPEDYVEFSLSSTYEILYVTINGKTYFQNLGRDLNTLLPPKSDIVVDVVLRDDGTPEIEAKNRSEWQSYENIFSNLTPTTIAYLFNSKKISRLSQKLESENVPPWSDFFIAYTYPNPNKNSFDMTGIQKTEKEKETATGGASVRSAKQQKARLEGTKGEDTKGFKTAKDVQRVLQKRSKTQQQMYLLVKNSARSCDTGFARATQTLMDGYVAFSKGRPGDIVSFMVHTIRNDIVDLLVATNRTSPETAGNIRSSIDTANSYGRDPDRIRRQIEKYVNDQITGCLDLIGDIVIDTVIDPDAKPSSKGLAGPIKKYWKDAIKPPGSLRIPKSPTSNFFGAWGKKLKQLTLKLVEQLILSILGDVISALLGCGPALPNTSATKMKGGVNAVFGAIRFNDVAEDNSIDLLEVAKSLSMGNITVSLDENGNKKTAESPATLDQLRQLNDDVSDFLTKTEALALLDGNLSPLTMAAIGEMINEGPYSVPSTGVIIESLKTDKQYMAQFQESLNRDDTKYATLGLNTELVRMYFKAIGDSSLNTEELLENLDPRAAFCAKYNISDDSPLLDLGISEAQLNAQIDNEVNKKVDKIKDLCDMIAYDGFAWQQDVIDFFDQFPAAAMYDKLLGSISKASQEAQKALLEAMKAQQDSTQNAPLAVLDYTDTEFYQFCENNFGTSKLDPIPFVERGGVFQWSVGDVGEGKISFFLSNEFARWFYQDSEEFKMWFSSPLNTSNNPLVVDNSEQSTYSLRGLSTASGQQNLGNEGNYPVTSDVATEMIDIASAIETSIRTSDSYTRRTYGQNEFISLFNADASITELLASFWVSPIGIRRLQPLRETLGKKAFLPGGPRCESNQSKAIAEAAYFGIEIRVINFILNVGPLMRAFPGWMTPDVLSVLSSYLTNNIFREWSDKKILNIYLDSLTDIDVNYSSGPVNSSGYNLEIDVNRGSRAQVNYIIQQILSTFFTTFGKGRAYQYPGTNFFNPESQWATEGLNKRSVLVDYQTLAHAYRSATWKYPGGYGVEPFSVDVFDEMRGRGLDNIIPSIFGVNPNIDTSWETKDALYYFPLPLVTAMQIIYFDQVVNINNKWPQFRFNTGRQVALADDALLSAVNETNVSIFSNPYNGYPVTIEGKIYYSREEVIQKIISLQQERSRIYELEALFGPLAVYNEDYENYAYRHSLDGDYLSKDLEEYRDFFNTLYQLIGPRYLEKHTTKQSKETLRRQVLQQWYLGSYPTNFTVGGSKTEPAWLRERAWYERARLLGEAGGNDNSLLTQWISGEDTPRFTIQDGDSSRRMNDEEWEKVKEMRTGALWMNSFDPEANGEWDEVLVDDFQGSWSEDVTESGVEYWNDGNHFSGAVVTVVGVVLQALFDPSVFGNSFGNVIYMLNPVNWVGWVVRAAIRAIDGTDRFRNPDDEDALKWFRNRVPDVLPRGTAATYIDYQQGLIDAEYNLPNHAGSADKLSTLDKAAISNMYYELAFRSQQQKPNSDPLNPDSEILLLLDYIDETDQQEYYGTAFPAYLDMEYLKLAFAVADDDGNPFRADHLSRKVFLSIADFEAELALLRRHPISEFTPSFREKVTAVETLYSEIVELVNGVETLGNETEDFDPDMADLRYFIDTEGVGFDQEDGLRQLINATIYANLNLFGDTEWTRYRDESWSELEDEIDSEIPSEDEPAYSEMIQFKAEVKSRWDEIMVIIQDLHSMYAEITNNESVYPRTYVGVDYDEYGNDDDDIVDTNTRARTWPMTTWVDAFQSDITKLVTQITWRES